jgi:His-Xaa-Ser system radical SAM maturase HxsB
MNIWPLRFREQQNEILFADEAGGWFRSNEAFLTRYAEDGLTTNDHDFLRLHGHAYDTKHDLPFNAFAYRWVNRQSTARPLSYVMLIPTLRCNLSCTYCQVSRAAQNAQGYDWSPEILKDVLAFLDNIQSDHIKIEFQGGEPLLRVDLLEEVRSFCRTRFAKSEFVVCTNLQSLGEREWAFLESDDTHVSTSIDGGALVHNRQRTQDETLYAEFSYNLAKASKRIGGTHLSALPTIDVFDPPDLSELIDIYQEHGLSSIYLRPINHQGFARRLGQRDDEIERWNALHADFIELLIERNAETGSDLQEYYFSQCLKRVLHSGIDNHVDIRNPNLFAIDYLVVDFNGTLYPTDESRMLSRTGQIDLSIGSVKAGIETKKIADLNSASLNNFDPDCIHCPYQAFCGTDLVDDISRYGRVDVPRLSTWFCKRHMALFDKVFELMYRNDEKTKRSLALWAGLQTWNEQAGVNHT